MVESEVDHGNSPPHAPHHCEIYGHDSGRPASAVVVCVEAALHIVRVDHGGEALARQTGLLDLRGRPVRGLPPAVVNGSLQDAEAVMRVRSGAWFAD